ncbi:MAG: hypothetical protein K0U98_00700 [Deltaproteobacteria bacterium]|nr:hypothetical protein [Deltaproteobacteria bacterium]
MPDSRRLDRIASAFGMSRRATTSSPQRAGWTVGRLSGRERFARAQGLISAFYGVILFLAVSQLYEWPGHLAATHFTPRWPVFWLRWVEPRIGISIILWLHLAAGVIGVAFSRYRIARAVVFLSLLEFLAFKFSFGSVNHGDHLGVLLSFVLIFLPSGWQAFPRAPRRVRAATLSVFSGCQGMILLIYSMSGMWKVGGVVEQLLLGETPYIAPQGLAQQIASKLLSEDSRTLLGPWLIDHWWVGWPLMVGALYLEFFSLWMIARPSLHRSWGLGLIALHISSHLTLGVGFAQNSLWLALFLVFSPFRPQQTSWPNSWRTMLEELPLLGRWSQKISSQKP